jgi:5'-deoxynucleotidase YfbR-like HD superfamily hydrolase
MAALTHDLAEIDTGDVPATAKWSSGDLTDALEGAEMGFNRAHGLDYDLSDGEAKMLSWADTFELCLYCRHQINTGNEYAEEILLNGLEHLRKKGFPTPKSKELYDAIFG